MTTPTPPYRTAPEAHPEPARRSTGGNTVVTERPATTLTRFLGAVFDTGITTSAEARTWLSGDGWRQLEEWLDAHRNDRPRRVATATSAATAPPSRPATGNPMRRNS